MARKGTASSFEALAVLGLFALGGCGGGAHPGAAGTAGTGIGGRGGGAGAAGSGLVAGRGGAAGTVGVAGTGEGGGQAGVGGGSAGAGGAGGSAGGGAGITGAGGVTGAINCTITAAASLSPAIPTVGVVTFTTDLPGITSAQIRFGLAPTGPTMTAPVDLTQASYRTLLLGMKGSSDYRFRIVATSGAGICTSADYPLMTGAAPSIVGRLTTTIVKPAAHAKGFIILGNASGTAFVYIVDAADGELVWGTTFRGLPSRAHMSWDGRDMYMVSENAGNSPPGANIGRIAMDGTNAEDQLSGLANPHHDFTVIPGGIAALLWNGSGADAPNSVVERSTDGTLTTVLADLADVYNPYAANKFHPSSIHYHAWDDSYTLGDPTAHLYVKITRKGQLVWQFGGNNPKDPGRFFPVIWARENHGHHLLADGTFMFFNNPGTARVFKLDTVSMTATSVLSYQATGASSTVLGDIQRLPSGNILVTFSTAGQIHEIDPSGQLVATFQVAGQFGYAEFRETLYGPPPY